VVVEVPEKAQNEGFEISGLEVSGSRGNRMSTNREAGEVRTKVDVSS